MRKAGLLALWAFVTVYGQQPPQVENAKLEARAFAGSLAAELAGTGPLWVAWEEPAIPGHHNEGCSLSAGAPVRLEGQASVVLLVRIENSQVDQLRVASTDCRFDAGGLPFVWLTGVPAAASVAWLKTQTAGKHIDTAVLAVALHAGADADRALDDLSSPGQPERVREKTTLWLGSSRGAHGVEALKRMLADDPSPRVREQAVFGLSRSKDAAGLAALIEAAKNDKDSHIRSKALFWLAQQAADKQAATVIAGAAANDPDRAVKEQAVFALKQLPADQGVPLLIEVAKNNPDPAVRKKAIFWLGQSTDPKALDFFAQVLTQ